MDCTAGSKKTYGKNPWAGVPPPDAPGLASGVAGGVRPWFINRRINAQAEETPPSQLIVESYRRDVKVVRPCRDWGARGGGGKRGAVVMLSAASRRRMSFTFRNCERLYVQVGLTYPGKQELVPTDGRVVKRHWANMRTWLVRNGYRGVWFLEFQTRGAPHFHLFIEKRIDHFLVAKRWWEIVGSKDLDHFRAGTFVGPLEKEHAAAAYAAKYATKVEQKEPPKGFENVGRFWGTFGGLAIEPVATVAASESLICEAGTGEVVPDPVLQAVRVARRLTAVRRKAAGLRPRGDNGLGAFTLYDAGPAMAEYLRRTGLGAAASLGPACQQDPGAAEAGGEGGAQAAGR